MTNCRPSDVPVRHPGYASSKTIFVSRNIVTRALIPVNIPKIESIWCMLQVGTCCSPWVLSRRFVRERLSEVHFFLRWRRPSHHGFPDLQRRSDTAFCQPNVCTNVTEQRPGSRCTMASLCGQDTRPPSPPGLYIAGNVRTHTFQACHCASC